MTSVEESARPDTGRWDRSRVCLCVRCAKVVCDQGHLGQLAVRRWRGRRLRGSRGLRHRRPRGACGTGARKVLNLELALAKEFDMARRSGCRPARRAL